MGLWPKRKKLWGAFRNSRRTPGLPLILPTTTGACLEDVTKNMLTIKKYLTNKAGENLSL